jgi:quercetin dioxygenase-like cupin family protein
MTRVRMGERSGYTSGWCDAPHWGLVTTGRLAIEWEDDVEILASGDVFYCPAGPPGHRIEAADPATFLDLTPIEALAGTRIADWRRVGDVDERPPTRGIAVAALG